jgi:hypothetical protein
MDTPGTANSVAIMGMGRITDRMEGSMVLAAIVVTTDRKVRS